LLATGYEQVRSVAAHLAGDHAAEQVQLELPARRGLSTSPASANPGAAQPQVAA
jgi:hypothetical protein